MCPLTAPTPWDVLWDFAATKAWCHRQGIRRAILTVLPGPSAVPEDQEEEKESEPLPTGTTASATDDTARSL